MTNRLLTCIAFALLLGILPLPASCMLPQYRATDLCSLEWDSGEADAINNVGQIVGSARDTRMRYHAFLWRPRSSQDLGTLGGSGSGASGINDSGQVVGSSRLAYGYDGHVFVWQSETGMLDIAPFGRPSSANDINNLGQIVGSFWPAGTRYSQHAFVYDPSTGMRDLGTLGGTNSHGNAVNNLAYVVGDSLTAGQLSHVFIWHLDSGMCDLGKFGGYGAGASDINDAGTVVGSIYYVTPERYYRAFVWRADAGVKILETLDGLDCLANAVNDRGQVVGYVRGSHTERAFIWDSELGMRDLNDLIDQDEGWLLREARDINNRGWIVGRGERLGQRHTAFLLRPLTAVDIDVMPGNRRNPINPGSNGVTSVAILGSADFDASQVDPSTVTLAGAHVSHRYRPSLRDVNGDHILDIVLQVMTHEMQIARGVTSAVLEGELTDGTPIEGEDAITVIVGR